MNGKEMPSTVWNEPTVHRRSSNMNSNNSNIDESSNSRHYHHTVVSKPTPIAVAPLSFLIMDAPRQSNLHLYIRECRKHGVTDIVRVCEPTYNGEVDLRNAGIELHEMAYDDGTSPSREILDRWLDLVHERFYKKKAAPSSHNQQQQGKDRVNPSSYNSCTIAVHCIAGLGRAPVMVAIALIEFAGLDPVDAVSLIRRHRRGAINEKQLQYLERYKKIYAKKHGGDSGCGCVIS